MEAIVLLKRIRWLIFIFIVGLVLSGATAIPLETEMKLLVRLTHGDGDAGGVVGTGSGGLAGWLNKVRDGLVEMNARYPFLAYGTDWLAFAHFVIALAFVGPWREPVRNVWVIEFGMLACVLVVPYALVLGGVREIPWGWRLLDCSFGVLGFVPLWICRRLIQRLSALNAGHSVPPTG